MPNEVLIETDGPVQILTLNRPDKLNAVNEALSQNLRQAITNAAHDDKIAVVILTGSGRAFSAGADLKEAAKNGERAQRQS